LFIYQKISKGPGAPVLVEGRRLCHGTMASPSLTKEGAVCRYDLW